ncbi:hypothetical protein [Pseudogemmobacter sonorensis]
MKYLYTIVWTQAHVGLPEAKAALNMRIDRDVLEFFKRGLTRF